MFQWCNFTTWWAKHRGVTGIGIKHIFYNVYYYQLTKSEAWRIAAWLATITYIRVCIISTYYCEPYDRVYNKIMIYAIHSWKKCSHSTWNQFHGISLWINELFLSCCKDKWKIKTLWKKKVNTFQRAGNLLILPQTVHFTALFLPIPPTASLYHNEVL